MKNSLIAVLAATAILFFAVSSRAQTITGTITGVVTDPSGAVIPNATVTVTNTATNVTHTTKTDRRGAYSVRFLQIGQYRVTASAPGFKTLRSALFALEVNQVAKIDAQLETGKATETVKVNGQIQPILDTQNPTISTTFTANTLKSVPLNGRNFSSVTQFMPGAVNTQPSGMNGVNAIERSTNMGGEVSVNGNRALDNDYFLDGVEINETISNSIGYNPAPEALQELTVITSNAGAQYGNANGGEVIAVTKNGTNHFHGSAYAYLENYNLDANSWANNFSGTPKQPFTQTFFGGTLGGPIKRNKLFFFVDYEGDRYHTGGAQVDSVFPAAFRHGDFSALLSPTNGGVQLTHYVTGQGQVPYPDNQVPVTNPVAQYLFAHPDLYPLPNKATPAGQLLGQNNYIGPYKNIVRNDQGDVKIDYRVGPRDDLNVRYSQGEASDATPEVPLLITFPAVNDYPFKGVAINEVHTFSNSIVNEFRAGWSRVRWIQGVPVDLTGAFGNNGNAVVGINYQIPAGYQGFSLQSFGAGGSTQKAGNETYFTNFGTAGGGDNLVENTFTYGDDLTFELGRHTLHAGVQVLRYQQNNFYAGNDGVMGTLGYTGAFTGSTIGDFDTDQVWNAGVSEFVGRNGQRQYRDAAYIQDDWQVTNKLALNLGLRYEYDQPIYEVNNKEANVDLATGTYYLAGTAAAGKVFGDARALYHPYYTDFQPRLGLSYHALPRLVIRGGYGMTSFLAGTGAALRPTFNPPFQPSFSYQAVAASATSPGTPLEAQNALPTDFSSSTSSNFLRAWASHLKPAMIQQYTLSTEYEINNHISATVGYVGQTGQHLINARAGNQLTAPGAVAPYASLVGQNGNVVITESEAMMNYNAAQVQLRYRENHGLEYLINYTFSKALSNNPGFFGTADVHGGSAYWQNAYDGAADYGPSGFDTRHNLNATAVYQLPFGRGRRYGSNMNKFADEIAGGWRLAGTAIAYSGFPVTINGPDTTTVNNKASRANHYRQLKIVDRSVAHWFGTGASETPCASGVDNGVCAYGVPAVNQFGTASVGTERAPGYDQVDLSASKTFSLGRSNSLAFQTDFFNAFNIASYDNPDSGVTDANFGQIVATRSLPRQIQFSLHYEF